MGGESRSLPRTKYPEILSHQERVYNQLSRINGISPTITQRYRMIFFQKEMTGEDKHPEYRILKWREKEVNEDIQEYEDIFSST